ncbi:hypothetical protein ACFE04_009272 [Oxalis oulophora]
MTMTQSIFDYPVGFRFSPSNEELVSHYLKEFLITENNRFGAPLSDILMTYDLYSTEPWNFPRPHESYSTYLKKNESYFFTQRSKISKREDKGTNPKRSVPGRPDVNASTSGGYWRSSVTNTPIHDSESGQVIGFVNNLCFYRNLGKKRTRKESVEKTDWLMEEYEVASFGNVLSTLDDQIWAGDLDHELLSMDFTTTYEDCSMIMDDLADLLESEAPPQNDNNTSRQDHDGDVNYDGCKKIKIQTAVPDHINDNNIIEDNIFTNHELLEKLKEDEQAILSSHDYTTRDVEEYDSFTLLLTSFN